MSGLGDGDPDGQKRNLKNIKGLWRNAVKTLKSSGNSSNNSGDDESDTVSGARLSHVWISDTMTTATFLAKGPFP